MLVTFLQVFLDLFCRREFWKSNEELLNHLIDLGQFFHANSSEGIVVVQY